MAVRHESLISTSHLLPSDLEARRQSVLVARPKVKGDPRKPPEGTPVYKKCREELGELEAVRQSMLNPFDIYAEVPGPGRIALVRKAIPHGMHEMTVMAQHGYDDGKHIDTLFGFPLETRQSFYAVGTRFAQYAEAQGQYPTVSFTYDPETLDRKAAQSVKMFHLQCKAITDEEQETMRAQTISLAEAGGNVVQRQLVDETSIAYGQSFHDYFLTHPLSTLRPIAPLTEDACAYLRFHVGSSWDDIGKPEFDQDFNTIHHSMSGLYQDFAAAAMPGTSGMWQRPDLSTDAAHEHVDGLEWMTDGTKLTLHQCIEGMHTKHLQYVDRLEKHGLTGHVYPLNGFCYGAMLSRDNQGQILLAIRPQVFSETGGTGLQYLDPVGAHVKMERGSGVYDDTELAAKIDFEKRCSDYIVSS